MPTPTTQRIEDFNGWFEVPRNPISKVGVFPYLGSSLGPDMIKEQNLDPDQVYMVYRSAEALSDPDFIFSCTLLPWINEHTMLGDEDTGYMKPEDKGIGGVTGEQVFFDPDDETLYANIKLFSEAHRNDVENGKTPLSLGYRCKYLWAPGEYNGEKYDLIQRNLRGNHLASVDDGRMGPSVAVLDHNDIKGASTMDEILKALAELTEAVKKLATSNGQPDDTTIVDDPDAVEVEDEDEPAADAPDAAADDDSDVPAEDADAPADAPAAPAAKPAVPAAKPAVATDADDATTPVTVEAMDAAVNQRVLAQFEAQRRGAALAAKLKPHTGVFDHSGKTEAQVAAYGVKKLGLTVSKGQEIPTLTGYLAGKGDPSKDKTVRNGMVAAQDSADAQPTLISKKLSDRSKA